MTNVLMLFDYRCEALLALEENYLAASPFGVKWVFCFGGHSGLTQGFSGVRLSVTNVLLWVIHVRVSVTRVRL